MAWVLQRSRRPRGWYYQVIHGRGRSRQSLTLGYLTDEEVEVARQHVGSIPRPEVLVTTAWDGDGPPPPPSKAAMVVSAKSWLFDTSAEESLRALEETARQEAQRKIARGDFSALTLQEFFDDLWKPIRESEAAESTVRAEKPYWKAILGTLGPVRIRNLSMVRWSGFLATRTTWSGRAQAIAQNAYRQCLKYAVEIGALEEVHDFRKIKGATKRTREPVEPLTAKEVQKVLQAAPSVMHRALFAYALGQGLRPGETTALQWEDLDWESLEVRIRGSKTDASDAVVPLMPLAETHLRTWWQKVGQPAEGPVFVYRGKPIKEWKNSWGTACRNAGIQRKVFPYLCRHTFATLAVAAGANPAAIKAMMRHTTKSTILENVYTRLNQQQIRAGMASPFEASDSSEPKDKAGNDGGQGGDE